VQALRDGKDPFLLPENVREYASWRTVNKPTWTTPWGRDVEGAGKSILRHAYGSVENHDRYAPRGLRSIDNDVTHTSIDDHAEVHSELLSLVKQFGGGN
jgi:hypothetical protein